MSTGSGSERLPGRRPAPAARAARSSSDVRAPATRPLRRPRRSPSPVRHPAIIDAAARAGQAKPRRGRPPRENQDASGSGLGQGGPAMDVLRQHEISESSPPDPQPVRRAPADAARRHLPAGTGSAALDLACGKGEMLCRWAERSGPRAWASTSARCSPPPPGPGRRARGRRPVGSNGRREHVRRRAGVVRRGGLHRRHLDRRRPRGHVELMRPALRPGGLLLVGEPYWTDDRRPRPSRCGAPAGGVQHAGGNHGSLRERGRRARRDGAGRR